MTIVQLQYFRAVFETSGFTSAAGRLGTSQASVSEQVARLESAEHGVGRKLIVRHKNGCTLTPAGRALARYAIDILDGVTRAKLAVAQAEQIV